MSENIKDALVYAVDLAGKEEKIIQDKSGKEWYDRAEFSLLELDPKRYPTYLKLSTLTSLVDYIESGLNNLLEQNLIVVVNSPTEVSVYSENDELEHRTSLAVVEVELPSFRYGSYYDTESFNIALQSRFLDKDDRGIVLDYASKIVIENGADITDDGVSQVTTIKNGVASKGKAKAPNPVTLSPFRTFLEVAQPSSQFVFRIDKNGGLALFEADGGKWKLDAVYNVAEYLRAAFGDFDNITVLA